MVPVPNNEAKPAIVADVKICTAKDAPWPPEQTKMIIGRADRKNRRLFAGVDMREAMRKARRHACMSDRLTNAATEYEVRGARMPIDISVMRRKTKKGVEEVVTTAEQRKQSRRIRSLPQSMDSM